MIRFRLFVAFCTLFSIASLAQANSPCDKVAVSGKYTELSSDVGQALTAMSEIQMNPIEAKKVQDGYRLVVVESNIPNLLGTELGTYGKLSLQDASNGLYCIAKISRDQRDASYRIAMAPNGDLILSSLDQTASDGSVVPELILYKLKK